MIGRLIQTFSSAEIAIDERHTPKLHARFLTTLLSKHRKDVSSTRQTPQQQQPPQPSQPLVVGPSGTHQSSASPDPTQHYPTAPPDQQQQQQQPAPGPADMSHGQQQTYAEAFGFAGGPNQAPQQYTTEPMVDGFDDELLGALQVLKSPGYWQTMMMPG